MTKTGARCKRSATGEPAGVSLCAQHGGHRTDASIYAARTREEFANRKQWYAKLATMTEAELTAMEDQDEEDRQRWDEMTDAEWAAHLKSGGGGGTGTGTGTGAGAGAGIRGGGRGVMNARRHTRPSPKKRRRSPNSGW